MGDHPVSIAVTPDGRADAVTKGPDDKLYFVEPHVEGMTMSNFLAKLSTSDSDVLYLQSQNGNVYTDRTFEEEDDPSEFDPLRDDIPKDVPWCTEAVDRSPDAVNLWIGDGRSVTSIHNDPYENIYTVVRGQKHFILLPPTDGWCMQERLYPHARYTRHRPDAPLSLQPSIDAPPVRWASIPDPHIDPETAFPPEVHPLFVTLNAGDTLYLPAGWWHHVRQSGLTIALNWWYDVEMRGMTWALLSFLRGSNDVPPGNASDAGSSEEIDAPLEL